MENIYKSLEEECRINGTNLSRICRSAKVNRSTVQRWKYREPNTIRLYRKLKSEIDKVAQEVANRKPNSEHD